MGFFSKVGKALKKAVKDVGKVAAAPLKAVSSAVKDVPIVGQVIGSALDINASFLTGHVSSGVKQIGSVGLPALAGTALSFLQPLGASAAPVATPTIGSSFGDSIAGFLGGLVDDGVRSIECAVLGSNCGPVTTSPISSGGIPTLSGPGAVASATDTTSTLILTAGVLVAAFLAWRVLRKG